MHKNELIYFDHAASSHPKPPEVIRAVREVLEENGANPGRSGHKLSLAASETVYRARKTVADYFGTAEEYVIFTSNATHAINHALKGLLGAGDHVIISDMEHNAVLRPLTELSHRGVEVSVAEVSENDETTVLHTERLIRPNTKLIFFTHASNVTGTILPVRAIGELCRKHGILFGVDASQTAGFLPYDLQQDPIDFLCVPGHKGLLGPQGTGCLILQRELPIRPLFQGGTGGQSLEAEQPSFFPEGHESGTLNTPGIAGLAAGIDFLREHEKKLIHREKLVYHTVLRMIRDVSSVRPILFGEQSVPLLSIAHERASADMLAAYLDEQNICVRGGFHCAALTHRKFGTEERGLVRLSFGGTNSPEEAEKLIFALKRF